MADVGAYDRRETPKPRYMPRQPCARKMVRAMWAGDDRPYGDAAPSMRCCVTMSSGTRKVCETVEAAAPPTNAATGGGAPAVVRRARPDSKIDTYSGPDKPPRTDTPKPRYNSCTPDCRTMALPTCANDDDRRMVMLSAVLCCAITPACNLVLISDDGYTRKRMHVDEMGMRMKNEVLLTSSKGTWCSGMERLTDVQENGGRGGRGRGR
mmetsp:Transcript_9041/g.28806  ORF Transcript_9041/g.28806 Transcript_9041/m.28806 type:complete len:209 (+) Transcript_9041:451-1077(+)